MHARTVRHIATVALAGGFVLTGPVAAFADGYAPATPSPTVSGVKYTSTTSVQDPASALPRTGTDAAMWTLAGGALVVAGAALALASRRRGQHG